jgi:rhodanese-related sulfurtransferase
VSFFAENWILILVALLSGGMLVWPLVQRSAGGSTAVGTAEAVRLINRERGVLVDVAEPGEFAQAHARGARNVPFGQLEGSKELPSNKALPLILMCPTGMRAGRAATLLRKAGYERAVAVSGGTRAWNEAALPVARGEEDAKAEKAARAEKPEKGDKGDKGAARAGGKEGRAGKRGKGARGEARDAQPAAAAAGTAAAAGAAAAGAATGQALADPAAGPATAVTADAAAVSSPEALMDATPAAEQLGTRASDAPAAPDALDAQTPGRG